MQFSFLPNNAGNENIIMAVAIAVKVVAKTRAKILPGFTNKSARLNNQQNGHKAIPNIAEGTNADNNWPHVNWINRVQRYIFITKWMNVEMTTAHATCRIPRPAV